MTSPPASSRWPIVASDLDGTLLDSGRGVSERTAAAIKRVRANDGRFLIITGRPVRWITRIVEQLGTTDPVIALNGAVVWDPVSDEVISAQPLDLALVTDLVKRLSRHDPDLCWAIERPLGYARSPEFAAEHKIAGSEVAPIDELLTGELTKLLGWARNYSPERFERIRDLVGDAAQVTHSGNDALIEIAAPGVHKAATLAGLVDGWALRPDDVIAFGDQVNDEEMLSWAGWGVAMANAAPHVQRLADEVTLSNDEAGVAHILEREFPLMDP